MKKSELIARSVSLCRARHLSLSTERTYTGWIARFFDFSRTLRALPAAERARRFLDNLAPRVSASTQNQALNALAFLFNQVLETPIDFGAFGRAVRPKRLPVWLTRPEIAALLGAMDGTPKLMAQLAYGAGLRLNEIVRLRIKDIDLAQGIIIVRDGKGAKDRATCLPLELASQLGERIERLRTLWQQDRAERLPGVALPGNFVSKARNAGKEWPWQWVFPARGLSTDPRSGIVRRHHLHPNTLQKAVTTGARRAQLNKRVTTHSLRHSFATHLLEDGCDLDKVRELLGHTSIQTTAIYLHCVKGFAATVRSPLDRVESKVVPFTPSPVPIHRANTA